MAPLIRRFPTRNILICTAVVFGLLSSILMIIDVSTGGRIKISGDRNSAGYHGEYSANFLYPIMCASGVAYGMVELIRRVIPRDIVGGDIEKLRQMDALVSHPLIYVSKFTNYFRYTYSMKLLARQARFCRGPL